MNHSKTITVPKGHVPDELVEWVKDNTSKCCMLCQDKFSLRNSRHHCRICGILVCKKCSENKIQFEGKSDSLNGEGIMEAHRSCNVCFENLQKLRLAEVEARTRREQEVALLNSTSRVDDSLLKLFFLDGSCKTVKFNQLTTVSIL